MKYPGESWQHQQTRERLAERDRQAEARSTAARKRPATPARRPLDATPAPATPEAPSEPPQTRWARHGGTRPHDYRMTPAEKSTR